MSQFEGAPIHNFVRAGRNRKASQGIEGTMGCEELYPSLEQAVESFRAQTGEPHKRNETKRKVFDMDFENISDELKEKAKACTTPEEILELVKSEGIELSDEQLEAVSGGGWTEPSCGDDTAWTYAC